MKLKYTQKMYNTTKRDMWKLVRKIPYDKRTKTMQCKIEKLGNKLNVMDDWRYKTQGRNFNKR